VSDLSRWLRIATCVLALAACGQGSVDVDRPRSGSVSLRGTASAPLAYAGGGIWSATVTLPAGRVNVGLLVDGVAEGAAAGLAPPGLAPPLSAAADPAAPLAQLELPLSGPFEVRFDERRGRLTLDFGARFRDGLPEVARALVDALEKPDDAHVGALRAAASAAELPIVRGGDVLFVDLERADESVAGTWNGWSASADPMVPLGEGALAYLGRPLGPGLRGAYKLVHAGVWRKDPRDFEIEWDGFDPGAPGDFNSVLYTDGWVQTGSRLRWLPEVASSALFADGPRDVYVYLPAGYDERPDRRYPSLYVQDGNESIVRSQFHQVADQVIAAGQAAPLILVFVALPTQQTRTDEYTFASAGARGDAYVRFLADELRPHIDASFRTLDRPDARGVAGASLGGLIALYAAWQRDDMWRRACAQSASLFWSNDAMIGLMQAGPAEPLRIYLDSGCPNDNCDVTRRLSDLLAAQSYDLRHVEAPGAQHDWADWRARFGGALAFLFPPSEY